MPHRLRVPAFGGKKYLGVAFDLSSPLRMTLLDMAFILDLGSTLL
jgi:hypothetical protein